MLAVLTVTTNQDLVDFADGQLSLREAIFVANTVLGADEIKLDFGHDGPATIVLTQGELSITDALTITGAGAELLTIDASGNDPTPEENNGDGSRVLAIDDGNAASRIVVSIDGLAFEGGDVTGAGGGISNLETLTLKSCVVRSNSATVEGGGVFHDGGGTLTIRDSRISNNRSETGGGLSLQLTSELVTLESIEIRGNLASGGRSVGYGGGIRFDGIGGRVEIRSATIAENRALYGGGVASLAGIVGSVDFVIEDSLIEWNFAELSGGGLVVSSLFAGGTITDTRQIARTLVRNNRANFGGGISVGASLEIRASMIADNKAFSGAGLQAYVETFVFVTIIDTTISGNVSRGIGGGLHLSGTGGGVTVMQSTISGNDAGIDGGGIYRFNSNTQLGIYHSTVTANRAGVDATPAGRGGGIFNSGGIGDITLDHNVIAGNTTKALGPGPENAFLASDGYAAASELLVVRLNLIGSNAGLPLAATSEGMTDIHGNIVGSTGEGVIDALLGPLAYNGGPVFLDGSRMLTHALRAGSLAIDSGDPVLEAGIGETPMFDQRGIPWGRVVNGDDVPEARIDMGAVEWQANPLGGDYNFDGVLNAADYSVWRDTLGSAHDLRADGSSATTPGAPDGVVDEHDYTWWKANFGNAFSVGGGVGSGGFEPQATGEGRTAGRASSGTQALAGELRLGAVDANGDIAEGGGGAVASFAPFEGDVSGKERPKRHGLPAVGGAHGDSEVGLDAALVAWAAQRSGESGVQHDVELELAGEAVSESDGPVLDEVFADLAGSVLDLL